MRVKNIKIAVRSDEEFLGEIKNAWEKLERGEKVKKHEGIYFESLEGREKTAPRVNYDKILLEIPVS